MSQRVKSIGPGKVSSPHKQARLDFKYISLGKLTVCTSNKLPLFTLHQSLQGKDQETQYEVIVEYYRWKGYNNLIVVTREVWGVYLTRQKPPKHG